MGRLIRTAAIIAVVVAATSAIAGCGGGGTPVAIPSVAPITDDEREALYEADVEDLRASLEAMHPGVSIPDVARVRFVTPEQWPHSIAECMTEAGYPASVTRDDGVAFEPAPKGQKDRLAVANFVCSAQFPVDPLFSRPLQDDQIAFLYAYYVDELIPCLETHGFEVQQPPSRELFADTFRSDPWSPYAQVSPGEEEDWLDINEACPQSPRNLFGDDG